MEITDILSQNVPLEDVQYCPGGLVGADLQSPLQAQCRDPVFAGSEQPAGVEPYR